MVSNRERKQVYRAGLRGWVLTAQPWRHGCSHEKQARFIQSQASEPDCQACPLHAHISWAAWPMPPELQWVSRRAHNSRVNHGGAGRRGKAYKPLFEGSGMQEFGWEDQSLDFVLWKLISLAQIKTKFLGNWTAPLNRTGSYILHITFAWWCGNGQWVFRILPARDQREGR